MPTTSTHKPAPLAAKPSKNIFDPFNSSSTGHQRADNRLSGSISWRESRNRKLQEQFAHQHDGGGKRMSDTVGAGSLDFGTDGRTENGGWERGASGLRKGGQKSILEGFGVEKPEVGEGERGTKRRKVEPTAVVNPFTPCKKADGSVRETSWTSRETAPSRHLLSPIDMLYPVEDSAISSPAPAPSNQEAAASLKHPLSTLTEEASAPTALPVKPNRQLELESQNQSQPPYPQLQAPPPKPPQIFQNLKIHLNGSTAPLISDHALKTLLTTHGAQLSLSLSRKSVTHVILGHASNNNNNSKNKTTNTNKGSGGGLASSKLQKEISGSISRCSGVKFVIAEWVIESVRAGRRLGEARFAGVGMKGSGQRGVGEMFARKSKGG
ncbi:hypothetical protein MBLNU230_g5823t1 [Neophaeotheca triangularis]